MWQLQEQCSLSCMLAVNMGQLNRKSFTHREGKEKGVLSSGTRVALVSYAD